MKIKTSSSVAHFGKKAQKTWNLQEWEGIDDPDQDLLFFGLFHDRDFEVFQNFKGQKSIFWCGGDILRVLQDYERQRILKINPATKHYCETQEEAEKLKSVGINPEVIPSYLGKMLTISFEAPGFEMKKTPDDMGLVSVEDTNIETMKTWKVWMCGHERRETEYGFDQAKQLAKLFSDVEFHFYGVRKEYEGKVVSELDNLPNVFYHGQVSEEQLDEEIKHYHCGLRCNENDGVSEVVIKSILLGQYPISRLPYEGVWRYQMFADLVELINKLKQQRQPNYKTRNLWLFKLNFFPWIKK